MTKQEEFLFIVQTTVLANSANLASDPDTRNKYRHVLSASGVFSTMKDAIYASHRIPDEMSADEAADDFITYMLLNLRDLEEADTKEQLKVPHWFAQY